MFKSSWKHVTTERVKQDVTHIQMVRKKKNMTHHIKMCTELWNALLFWANYTADIPATISTEPHKLLVKI